MTAMRFDRKESFLVGGYLHPVGDAVAEKVTGFVPVFSSKNRLNDGGLVRGEIMSKLDEVIKVGKLLLMFRLFELRLDSGHERTE